jgi:hypothetical protein
MPLKALRENAGVVGEPRSDRGTRLVSRVFRVVVSRPVETPATYSFFRRKLQNCEQTIRFFSLANFTAQQSNEMSVLVRGPFRSLIECGS